MKDYQSQKRTLHNSSRRKNNPECVYTPKLELQDMGGNDNIGMKVVRLVLLFAGVAENTRGCEGGFVLKSQSQAWEATLAHV